MELRKEWFEPGPDSVSPFEREWRRTGKNDFGGCISAAFRALLAGEDVGRTADAKDAEIARLTAERDEARRVMIEAKAQRDKFWSQRDAARAEVERLEEIVKDTNNVLDVMTRDLAAERDALQARIDAGVRVYSLDCKDWHTEVCLSDNHSATLIIDQPDAAMVDERTGKADRREKNLFGVHGRPGKSDRRRVAGTRADRGQAS